MHGMGIVRGMQHTGSPKPNPSSQNRIADLRSERELSQEALASVVGVNASTVSRWEHGASIPDWRKQQLAEFFRVSVSRLMGWDA